MSKRRSFENLLTHLEESIISRKILPGEKLPTERELQEKNKISRGTVREALRALEQKGMIEVKKGAKGGAFVKEVENDHISRTLALFFRHNRVSLKDFHEFRLAVESISGALAAERAGAKELEDLKNLLQEMKRLLSIGKEDLKEFYRCEMRMHRALGKASKNILFELILDTIIKNAGRNVDLLFNDKRAAEDALSDWYAIIKAIENGESTLTRSLVTGHLIRFRTVIEDKMNLIEPLS
ncbi:MAG: FadR family transcriptional regulator [Deltaproteobacteria bacterium]|nr:FadR family transcriptional regulator [Deltaproteobacteria bacterium]